jgi:hypothetical protein
MDDRRRTTDDIVRIDGQECAVVEVTKLSEQRYAPVLVLVEAVDVRLAMGLAMISRSEGLNCGNDTH